MCILLFIVFRTVLTLAAEVEVKISTVPLAINMQEIDNEIYPIIMYNDIVYIPQELEFSLGYSWSPFMNHSLAIVPADTYYSDEEYIVDRGAGEFRLNNRAVDGGMAECHSVNVNKRIADLDDIDNKEIKTAQTMSNMRIGSFDSKEIYENNEYPILNLGGSIYIPLTYDFAQKMGWEINYTNENGLTIYADCHVQYRTLAKAGLGISSPYSYYNGGYTDETFTIGTTVIKIRANRNASNTMNDASNPRSFISISSDGEPFREITLVDEHGKETGWELGYRRYTLNGRQNEFVFVPQMYYGNGTLIMNAYKIDNQSNVFFADITIDLNTGIVLEENNIIFEMGTD